MPSRIFYLLLFLLAFINYGCSPVLSDGMSPDAQIAPPDEFKKIERQNINVSAEDLKNAKERIAKVAFHSDFLWILGQNGILLRVNLAAKKAEPFEFASYVADIYINEKNEFYLLTGKKTDSEDWQILKKNGDNWLEAAKLKIAAGKEREITGLAEYQGRFLVLSKDKVYLQQKDNEWKTVKLKNEGNPGLQTPFAVTEDGFIYVGLNNGEFGGGLWQINLKDGSTKSIEKKTVGKICYRPLYAGCDPVTSVIKDSENSKAVLAGIGLRHFSEQGRLVKVTSGDVSVVFNKTYKYDEKSSKTIPENPCDSKNETNNLENFESEGVFDMQSDGKSVWLVTGRAVYKLAGETLEACTQVPKNFEEIDGILISKDISGVVLVGTDINWAKSLSGITPLIAVKR